ncbi:potassium voltage-gated channel subfamily H member 2 isoform X1 [Metopolophium dirhodum]|uniref:potassium voltage-gated channel subfamily H member 2 isoform X1 n=2 Tax=Metopolophium dirhodum TaxID=44670 RepID=UPI0029906CFA|nr:potassium voltage-gated channel subfamily H member 2 isoform X1 [Metopolophium dirhodum]
MPIRRGHVTQRTTVIETIIRKFDTHNRSFLVANAQQAGCNIIYCSDGFCHMTGYSRAEVMQCPAICDFLQGPMTSQHAVSVVKEALAAGMERHFEILYYRKDGSKFLCSEVIAPVKSEVDDICLYIINFEDLTSPPSPVEQPDPASRLSKFDRARQSFRQSLRMSSFRGRNARQSGRLTPLPHEDEYDEESSSTHLKTPSTPKAPDSLSLKTAVADITSTTTARVEDETTSPRPLFVRPEPQISQPHRTPDHPSPPRTPNKSPDRNPSFGGSPPARSNTDSVLASRVEKDQLQRPKRPHTIDIITEAYRSHFTGKSFPNTSSETDLQKYNTSTLWDHSTSLGNLATDSLKYKYSIQDNGSAKFFQGALHTPNMGEKVAQVLSLGADILPEYKLQSPKIHKWTILHYSPFKAVWDWIILLLVIYTAIFTPYFAAFLLNEPHFKGPRPLRFSFEDPLVVVDFFVDITFIIDIAINFRTTYVNKNDEVVSAPSKIALNYFRGWFLIDLVAAIPFDLLIAGSSAETDELTQETQKPEETTTLIGLLKTARLLRLVRVARKIDRYSEYGAAVLLLLMATFALIAHWLACIWYAIGNAERRHVDSKVGWLDILANDTHQFYSHNNTGGPSIRSRYITALYFTFSSLTSVGFGNVAPNTDAEKAFTICVMLVGSLMYASIFGNVSAIIQRLYSGTARYHTQMLRVREFIRFHQIPNPLRQRLEEYFQHAWTYTNGIDMNSVLKGFPECLQADICLHLNRNLLKNCSAFNGASPGCLRALSLKFRTTHAPPGDTLVHQGDVLTSLYFISRGSIEILKDNVVMAILSKNDIFGENPCKHATIGKSCCNVRALTYCDLHKIDRNDLLEVLDLYPEFYHSFKENLEITYYMRDETQVGVDPRAGRFSGKIRSRSSSQEPIGGTANVGATKKYYHSFHRGVSESCIGPSEPLRDDTNENDNVMSEFNNNEKYAEGHGILEFSTDKAGQDVTPMNLKFDDEAIQNRGSTLNSISGMFSQLKRSVTDIRLHGLSQKPHGRDEENGKLGNSGGLRTSTSHKHLFASQCNENQPLLDHQLPISESSVLHQHHKENCSEHTSVQNMSAAGFSTTASSHYGTPTAQSPLHSACKAQTPPFPTTSMSVMADNTTVITPPSPQRVITCSQCGHSDVHYRIDRLTKQLDNLELSVSSDIKTILHILKHKNGELLTTESRPDGCRLRPSPIKKTSSIPTSDHLPRPTLAVKFRSSSQDEMKSDSRCRQQASPIRQSSDPQATIPRRSYSQPHDLCQTQQSRFIRETPSANLFDVSNVTTVADATPPVASLKRQQFASLRCNTSCSSDEGNVIEFTPLAPLARLDSLHEMDTSETQSRTSSTTASPTHQQQQGTGF